MLLQLGHTCVVLMRRAIWSIDPTVFEPQYDLQVLFAHKMIKLSIYEKFKAMVGF